MKKTTFILLAFLSMTTSYAQKALIKTEKITLDAKSPKLFDNIKTFEYIIQDDGKYWNHTPTDLYPTISSLVDIMNIDGLQQVDKDGDIKIVAGLVAQHTVFNNGLATLPNAYYNLKVLTKENKLIYGISEYQEIKGYIQDKEGKFIAINTNEGKRRAKATILTQKVMSDIEPILFLFTKKNIVELSFGYFKKTKGGAADAFNKKTKIFVKDILQDYKNTALLEEAIAYWKSQLKVDFGKKLKEKAKNKVIYVNIATASLLKNDIDQALKYKKLAKENKSFFDTYDYEYKKFLASKELEEKMQNINLKAFNYHDKSCYSILIDKPGKLIKKNKKEIPFAKVEIDRFLIEAGGGMANLNRVKKPNIYLYDSEGTKTYTFPSNKNNKIIIEGGKSIYFKEVKGSFVPFIKQADGKETRLED